MIHPLSRSTTYIETYAVRADNGQQCLRSYATGFFIRTRQEFLLVTNWHVVTGLDPADPSKLSGQSAPHLMKLAVPSKGGGLTELTVPLYDNEMKPLWLEHVQGPAVDIVVYPLPLLLEKYFSVIDIQKIAGNPDIGEVVGKDVFILGYPFSKGELRDSFGEGSAYFLPVWKRGSIATEPDVRLGGHVLLIDSLSRPGMSGAPVLIAQDEKMLKAGSAKNADVFKKMREGSLDGLDAIRGLDVDSMRNTTEKRFKFVGVYSGVIGNTRLEQVALGKCWHVDSLNEILAKEKAGEMPYHVPMSNQHYTAILDECAGKLVWRDADGNLVEQVQFN